MIQPKFIWTLSKVKPVGITQFANGVTACELVAGVEITHNSRKNNHMILIFKEDQKRYSIDSDSKLDKIIHVFEVTKSSDEGNKTSTIVQTLRSFAAENLEEIK